MIDAILLRPRLIMLVMVMLCLAGMASFGNMARQEDPQFPPRDGLITVSYPGTTAEAIERLILEPLQDELSQVEEVLEFSATARTGVALVNIGLQDFLYDTAPAWERVRIAMERARLRFPDGVGEMELDDRLDGLPAVVLAVAGDPSAVTLSLAAEQLKRQLMDLPGLSRIELEGEVDEQITIALQDSELSRLGLTPNTIAGILAQRNQVAPGGFLVVEGRRINLLSNNEFTSLDAIESTKIPVTSGGSVPLAAIADVRRTPVEPVQPETWQDGERVVVLSIYAESNQIDAIQFGSNLRSRVDLLRDNVAPLEIRELFFQPDQVESRLSGLQQSLLISMLIITLVVFYGMGWRMGVLVAAMLPLVTLISLGIYDLGGGVLHQIAVIGVVISLGILIDNAIVIAKIVPIKWSSLTIEEGA